MKSRFIASEDLVPGVIAGETWAIARLISRAEAGQPETRASVGEIYRRAGRAHVVGITGVPGSGKSTMVSKLAQKYRDNDNTVAIVAIDPSSPYSGGAILGDRIRMTDLALDPGIFIRSMATRGATGGMAHAALDVVDVLDVAGFDIILIETVGVGQDEVEIANASHTTVVVSAPGLGDEVQAIKAGILEIADLHVVSKCDRSDANRALTDLKVMLKDGLSASDDGGWRPRIIGISSYDDEGFEDLIAGLNAHREFIIGPAGTERRKRIAGFRVAKAAETLLLENFREQHREATREGTIRVLDRESDPYSVASALVQNFKNETANV